MGVKLKELIVKNKIDFKQLEGKIIAVDAPNIIFSLFSFSYKNHKFDFGNLMTDRTQRVISHLYGLLYRINFFYSKKVFPIFCFDGRESELKRLITKDLLNDYAWTDKYYKTAMERGDIPLAKKIALSKDYLWPNIIKESKQLLSAMGVPHIESPSSAESQCAQLVKDGIADYSNSQDMDSVLYGCPKVLQNISKSQRRKQQGRWKYNKVNPVEVLLSDNLKQLNINQFELVDLAIMVGVDFFPGIKGIGSKKALYLIKKYQNLERVIQNEKSNYDFSKLTYDKVMKIREIFLFPDVLTQYESFQWTPPNKSLISKLLCEDHNLNKERVSNNTEKLVRSYSRCRQYFESPRKTPSRKQKTLDMSF